MQTRRQSFNAGVVMWVFFFERRLFSVVLGDIFMVPGNGDSVIIFNVTEMVFW